MKKLSKIKLNQFSKAELDQRAMNALKGGSCCCVCVLPECPTDDYPISTYTNSAKMGGYS